MRSFNAYTAHYKIQRRQKIDTHTIFQSSCFFRHLNSSSLQIQISKNPSISISHQRWGKVPRERPRPPKTPANPPPIRPNRKTTQLSRAKNQLERGELSVPRLPNLNPSPSTSLRSGIWYVRTFCECPWRWIDASVWYFGLVCANLHFAVFLFRRICGSRFFRLARR